MNRDDVIRWMHEVGAKESNPTPQTYDGFVVLFQQFAKLAAEWAAKQERDECVKVCEEQAKALMLDELSKLDVPMAVKIVVFKKAKT